VPVYVSNTQKRPISYIKCQIVDTPGILDRSLEERNEIELRAIAALKNLATAIVFIFDFTQINAIVSQTNLFNQISERFHDVPMILIFGKEDLLEEGQRRELDEFRQQNFPQKTFYLLSMNDKTKIKELLIQFYQENREQIQKIMIKRKTGEV
jgi:nucleolar GTP-binding protein